MEGTTEYDVSCTAQADSSGVGDQAGLLGSRDLGEMLGFALPALGMVLAGGSNLWLDPCTEEMHGWSAVCTACSARLRARADKLRLAYVVQTP